MQGGDISNHVAPRIRMIFEGLVASPPAAAQGWRRRWPLRGARSIADPNQWELSDAAIKLIWELWRRDFAVDIVTYLGEAFAAKLTVHLAELPIGQVYDTTPAAHARELTFLPTVVAVLDPDPGRQFTYPRGRGVIVDPAAPGSALAALGL